jgi:DNA-binding NarL/FixJ family response regulator
MLREAQDHTHKRESAVADPAFAGTCPPLSVVIIEARALIRECLALCLQKKLDLPVLTFASVRKWSEDPACASACVVILSGVDRHVDAEQTALLRELSSWERDVPIVVFSDNENRNNIAASLRCGAKGYVPSDTPLEVAARAIKLVLVGGVFVPANVLIEPPEGDAPQTVAATPKLDFTARENDVVKALLKGKSNKVIAYDLSLSESSVKVHIRNVMRKLQVRNRTEAVIRIGEILGAGVEFSDESGERESAPF